MPDVQQGVLSSRPSESATGSMAHAIPPHIYFAVSALFHSLGPAFAVLLFVRVSVLGVAWLRIASAALVLCLWCRPWKLFALLHRRQIALLAGMGIVLGVMNVAFYLAINRIPLATVSAIECLGPLTLAAWGVRSGKNIVAVGAAAAGAILLTGVHFSTEPVGLLLAFANAGLFSLYIIVGHRIVREKIASSIERLAIAMLFALLVVSPIGLISAFPAVRDIHLVWAGIGVGVCSSVIPYVCDQLAMARLPRSTFALLLFMLPAVATIVGAVVLHQIPALSEMAGIGLIAGGLALHSDAEGETAADALPKVAQS